MDPTVCPTTTTTTTTTTIRYQLASLIYRTIRHQLTCLIYRTIRHQLTCLVYRTIRQYSGMFFGLPKTNSFKYLIFMPMNNGEYKMFWSILKLKALGFPI